MSTLNTDAHITRQHHEPINVDRLVILRNLIRLCEVLVKVVFAVKRACLHSAIEREAKTDCELDCATINNWKRSRQTECDGIDVGVWLVTKMVWTCREQLGLGV